jgi:hypothetical protein
MLTASLHKAQHCTPPSLLNVACFAGAFVAAAAAAAAAVFLFR